MERFSRSMSSREKKPAGFHPSSMRDLRSYSTSDYNPNQNRNFKGDNFKDDKTKKGSNGDKSKISSSLSSRNWNFNSDPAELQRKKRVAAYKAYSVEGKVKSSFRKSFRWMKDVVHGFW